MNSISIVIPAYNSGKTIRNCLYSIEIQSKQPDFVMVINDCSIDDTAKILETKKTFTKNNTQRMGKAASINSALEYIKTDYVLILDSDTYLERDFIKKLSKTLDSDNYDGGSGSVKYIGKNDYSKKVAKKWHNRTWRYNGCCQFFKTSVLNKLRYCEDCYTEDEEIFQRMEKMKTIMVDAWAYTEVTTSPGQYFNQRLRWLRGDAQLLVRNRNLKDPKWIVNAVTWIMLALVPMMAAGMITYTRNTTPHPFLTPIMMAAFLLFFGIDSATPFDLKSTVKGIFLYSYVFIEVVILRSTFNLDYWERCP